ncbi:uncharacterized protein [Leptinotarsa decemlineata]|uniref:uncharacterized protein n=1 Tax=Leptinotarsa decemlineata TaxID=7539 RepID=UPI003D304822
MYGGMSRNKFMLSLVSKNETNDESSSSSIDDTSNPLLEINKLNNNDALVMNKNDESEPENCNELQKEIDEAIKVSFDNRGDQKDELLNDEIFLIGDQVNGTTLTELSNTKQEIAKRNNVQGEPERHDIDIAEAGPSGTFMDNKKRCENDQNYVPDKSGSESEYEESEDEYLNMSEQLRKEMGAGEQENK